MSGPTCRSLAREAHAAEHERLGHGGVGDISSADLLTAYSFLRFHRCHQVCVSVAKEPSARSSRHFFTHSRQAFPLAADRKAAKQACAASEVALGPHNFAGEAAANKASANGRDDDNFRRNSTVSLTSPRMKTIRQPARVGACGRDAGKLAIAEIEDQVILPP